MSDLPSISFSVFKSSLRPASHPSEIRIYVRFPEVEADESNPAPFPKMAEVVLIESLKLNLVDWLAVLEGPLRFELVGKSPPPTGVEGVLKADFENSVEPAFSFGCTGSGAEKAPNIGGVFDGAFDGVFVDC